MLSAATQPATTTSQPTITSMTQWLPVPTMTTAVPAA